MGGCFSPSFHTHILLSSCFLIFYSFFGSVSAILINDQFIGIK
jgi:hypothetical protein